MADDPGSDEATPRPGWAPTLDHILVLGLVIVALRIGLQPLVDNSFLTHLSTGRLILDHGAIPRHDPYSWTAHGHPWTVQSWGASVVYAGLERWFGLAGIRVLNAGLMSALVVVLWRLTAPAERLVGRFLATMLAVILGAALWTERPLLFGALFLALVYLIVEEERDPRWLVPIMWMWVNVHGSFPFALGLVGMLAVGRFLDERRLPRVELRALGWTVVGTLVGALNPLGWRLLVFPLDLLSNREAFSEIAEWQPPSWERPVEKVFLIQLVLVVALVLWRNRHWRTVLPMVVFAGLAVTSARNLLQASIVFTPLLAGGLHGLGSIRGDVARPAFRGAFGALVVLAGLVLVTGLTGSGAQDFDASPYPRDASHWMEEEGLLGVQSRVVSQDFVGNYLAFEFGPDRTRNFIDDRVDMFPVQVIQDYTKLLKPHGDYQAILERYRATSVLWARDSNLGRYLSSSPQWQVVHRDEAWLVAVPRAGG